MLFFYRLCGSFRKINVLSLFTLAFILHDGLEYQLLLWFLCARFFSFAGYALNRFGEREVFHVFGDAMSVMVVCLVLSAVAGFDPNLFL